MHNTDDDNHSADILKKERNQCRDLFRLYTDTELIAVDRRAKLDLRKRHLQTVLEEDYNRENLELKTWHKCYGEA